jgi:CheY-like chemotaxis protein
MAKILVVDDDPDIVHTTSKVLKAAGYEVIVAANGAKALHLMRHDRPDLVLLDMMMSYVLDGLDVTREMAADPALAGIPVIMVSSVTAVRDIEMLPGEKLSPVDDWLSKPVSPQALLDKVAQVLGQ